MVNFQAPPIFHASSGFILWNFFLSMRISRHTRAFATKLLHCLVYVRGYYQLLCRGQKFSNFRDTASEIFEAPEKIRGPDLVLREQNLIFRISRKKFHRSLKHRKVIRF